MTDDEDVIIEFEASALAYGAAVDKSDVKTIGEHAHRMSRLFQRVIRVGEIQVQFLDLLGHPEPSVRLMASAYGLSLDEESCTRELQELAAGDSFKFEAEQCLQRWKDGDWALDVPEETAASEGFEVQASDECDPLTMARSFGQQVSLSHVTGSDELDIRVGCVNVHFANIIGIGDGFIEFCPNSDPPSDEELLAWVWVVRPESREGVLRQLGDHDFAEGIRQLV